MQRTLSRLALVSCCAAALTALVAAPAQAADVTTGSASTITTKSAVLNGILATGGGDTIWTFQWGKTPSYGNNTPSQTITAGHGTVDVSAKISSLSPGTTYHFRLVAVINNGTAYQLSSQGDDASFTTASVGKLTLDSTRRKVKGRKLKIPLTCESTQKCEGTLTLGSHGVICVSKSFSIDPGSSKKVKAKISKACRALLEASAHHKIKGRLEAVTTTGQQAFNKKVRLKLG